MMEAKINLRVGLKAGGAPLMWERVFKDILPTIKTLVPVNSLVLEIGYGDGLLTCFLCEKLGWRITGLDISKDAHQLANRHALECGVSDQVCFYCCAHEETRKHSEQYDAVFVKTVLYSSPTLEEYRKWLDWILSVLKPGGFFINFETGWTNALTQFYRRMRRRSYTNLCLYNKQIEAEYDQRFEIVCRHYYGGISQFFSQSGSLYNWISFVEEKIRPRHADNSFIVSIIARRPLVGV